MLAELIEGDHRQQARTGPTARDHMERRRRLADLLAVPAGELLAHMLDDLPLARDHLQRFGDVLAQRGQARAAAAETGAGSGHDDPLPGQVFGERPAGQPLARKGGHRSGLGRRGLGGDLVAGGRRLQFLQLQFHLVRQPRGPLGVGTEPLAVQLGDLKLELSDQGLVVGLLGASRGKLGLRRGQRRLQRFDVFRGGGLLGVHKGDRITKSAA